MTEGKKDSGRLKWRRAGDTALCLAAESSEATAVRHYIGLVKKNVTKAPTGTIGEPQPWNLPLKMMYS